MNNSNIITGSAWVWGWVLLMSYIFLQGCDSDKTETHNIRKEISGLSVFALDVAKTERKPFTLMPEPRSYTNLFISIKKIPDETVRSNLLFVCEDAILDFRLDDRTYLSRLRSLQIFENIALAFSSLLYEVYGNYAHLWNFKIKAMKRIRREIDEFHEERNDRYSSQILAIYDRQQYDRALKVVCADMLISTFYGHWAEHARAYLSSLTPDDRRKWLLEIENAFGCLPDFNSLDLGLTSPNGGKTD